MQPTIRIVVLDFLDCLLYWKVKQMNEFLQTVVLHFVFYLVNELANHVLYWCLVNLVECLLLFFSPSCPVIFHLLDFFLFGNCYLVFLWSARIYNYVWKVLEKKFSQGFDVVYLR
jgi:hypothetical protein